ncbi:MAG: S-layer homology domain-containing protein, partial [Nitriliruptoraceae bacterium]
MALAPVALVAMSLVPAAPATAQSAEQHDTARPPALLCPDEPETADLEDRDDISAAHIDAIDCLVQLGVAEGLGSDVGTHYLPDGEVRRDQMASFVIRTLEAAGAGLPAGEDGRFDDVPPDNVHRDAIEQLAEIGVVQGVTEDTYDPDAPVSRDQMASFLLRATAWYQDTEVEELTGGATNFDDIGSSAHAEAIAGIYHLGITYGTKADVSGARYEPAAMVTREQMASFLVASSRAMLTDPATCTDPVHGYH